MHRIVCALIVIASALTVSTAHADDLTCGDFMSGDYQPDELPPASQVIAEAARACVCDTYCAPFCSASDGDGGAACMLNAPGDFAGLGGDVSTCALCESIRCGAVVDACMADGA